MTKQEMLEECISLAYKINEYGAYVFVRVSPHTKQTDFTIHLDGWAGNLPEVWVTIYETEGYSKFKVDYQDDQPNNVEELHEYLAKMLREKERLG